MYKPETVRLYIKPLCGWCREVIEWLDCGNKDATVYTCERVLDHNKNTTMKAEDAQVLNSKIIEPCYIGSGTKIENSTIGPNVSIGENTIILNSQIKGSIIQNQSKIENAKLCNSMIGNNVVFDGHNLELEVSIGDFSEVK